MKALEILKLRKTYKNKVVALDGISFDVDEGDFFALLGPNGAGKSTAINIVASLVNKTGGAVRVLGYDLEKETDKAKECIGLVPQEFNCNIFEKVIDIVIDQAGYYGVTRKEAIKRADYLLKRLGLWDKKNTPAQNLSGGMKRRLMVVRALIHKPKLLILDEPTAGVDVESRREMWDFLKEMNRNGATIILTTHYLEEAEQLCEKIAIINKGVIVENTTVKHFLSKLDKEVFILDLKEPVDNISPSPLFKIEKQTKNTLIVEVSKEQYLNDLFNHLEKDGIKVLSMRNKANRLEELFINLTRPGQ